MSLALESHRQRARLMRETVPLRASLTPLDMESDSVPLGRASPRDRPQGEGLDFPSVLTLATWSTTSETSEMTAAPSSLS